MSNPRGVAVNQSSGNVYAVDGSNNRIVEFNSSGEFLRAFGQDVVESGPDNNGTGYEICVPASGDTCKAGVTGATGGALSSAQGVAINQETGNLYVTDGSNLRVDEFGPTGTFIAAFGQAVVASGPGLVTAASAVQTLTVTATGGDYTLTFGGKTTAELAFNASASAIQTALTGLSSIGSGNVTVTEASAGVYKITFAGALANNPEPLITAATAVSPNELVGGTASVANTTTGATGFDVCVAANGDVCKAGTSASTGGAFKTTFNGYPIVAPAGAPNAGDVLVADGANLRAQEFTAGGAFVRAFGFNAVTAGPDNKGTTFEVCTAANGDACGIGATGAGSGQFATNALTRIAEDASGNIYTVESLVNFRVQRFTLPSNTVTPQGNFDEADLKGTAATSTPSEVEIDPATSDVLVTKAFLAGATASCPATGAPSVAERRVVEVSAAGALQATHMACAGINNNVSGLAVRSTASTGDIYVSSTTTESRLYVLNAPLVAPSDAITNISGITAHGVTISGFVNPNGPAALPYGLHTTYHFAYKRSTDATFTNTLEVDAGKGTTNIAITRPLAGLVANTSYEVELVASRPYGNAVAVTPIFTFTTPPAGPEVGTPSVATAATDSGARVAFYGNVNPNGQATTYRFEYGTSPSYGTDVPVPNASVGSGGAMVSLAQYVNGLEPATTYHFRIVASNAAAETFSPDQTFTTPPLGSTLPDGRSAELVSPADKRPVGNVDNILYNQLYFQAAEDGESMAYIVLNGLGDSTAGGEVVYSATRAPGGWSSMQVTPPALVPAPVAGEPTVARSGAVRYFSPEDLRCGFVETNSPLSSDTPVADVENSVYNLYRWNAANGTYTLITDRIPLNPSATETLNYYYEVAGVSADCSRVFFRSKTYTFLAGATGVYEWNNGALREALTRPDRSTPAGSLRSTGGGQAPEVGEAENTVSPDGHFFFAATSDQGADSGKPAVFVRKSPTETVDASQPATSVPTLGAGYETASPDGSWVFFLANYGIASTSSGGPTNGSCGHVEGVSTTACDLYGFDVENGRLTDLSTDPNPVDSNGAVVEGVVAVSNDGGSVYFAARGQLVPGQGRTYAQNLEGGGHANIYLSRHGELAYVGSVTGEDLSTVGGHLLIHSQLGWSAQTNRSGTYLLFGSQENPTGSNPAGQEVAYLYSAEAGSTQCVSCRMDGAAPHSMVPGQYVIKPKLSWGGNKYTPRSLSEDGRVVFSSEDALAPGGVEGHGETVGPFTHPVPTEDNVYEWYRGKISLLATGQVEYVDMGGPDGRDVFIKTYQKLVPQDFDFSGDIYDLRAGGGFPSQTPLEPCDPEVNCQGEPLAAPVGQTPASSVFSGPGNELWTAPPSIEPKAAPKPASRSQKLASALKACRSKPKKKRASCIRQAEKRYGATGKRRVQGKAKSSRGAK